MVTAGRTTDTPLPGVADRAVGTGDASTPAGNGAASRGVVLFGAYPRGIAVFAGIGACARGVAVLAGVGACVCGVAVLAGIGAYARGIAVFGIGAYARGIAVFGIGAYARGIAVFAGIGACPRGIAVFPTYAGLGEGSIEAATGDRIEPIGSVCTGSGDPRRWLGAAPPWTSCGYAAVAGIGIGATFDP